MRFGVLRKAERDFPGWLSLERASESIELELTVKHIGLGFPARFQFSAPTLTAEPEAGIKASQYRVLWNPSAAIRQLLSWVDVEVGRTRRSLGSSRTYQIQYE